MPGMTLIARPISARRRQELVHKEVEKALAELSKKTVDILKKDVEKWVDKPDFKVDVKVGDKVWKFLIKVDKRTNIGKIYTWVDQGTGERGNIKKSPYEIRAKNVKALSFTAPTMPKTMPYPSQPNFPKQGEPKQITTVSVIHPGIYPRNFTNTAKNFLKGRHEGSFRNVIEAAVKRAYRKIEKGNANV